MAKSKRMAGILLHPTSLPSSYGIGDLGKGAYAFVDFLEKSGQQLWQTLPLSHTGFGDSPYQSFSAFAGQPLLIAPEIFVELGLLKKSDLKGCPNEDSTKVDYGPVINWKTALFHKAYDAYLEKENIQKALNNKLTTFCEHNTFWLDDYALFLVLKDENGGKSWLEWDDELRLATDEKKAELAKKYEVEMNYYKFVQFFFFTQWRLLKKYANKHGVKIIGDIPIFVSMDSADVWANKGLFKLDTKGFPISVAGVPPDYFSETGQLWGNPLYDWDAHLRTNFAWWISRVSSQLENLDILRIDHFRGFESFWSIPYGEKTAINGKWIKAPGKELFSAIQKVLGKDLPIIAEDLGTITKEVTELREGFGFPGMKILQFAFESTGEGDYLPHNYPSPNCVCYTGTHDNDTTVGWYKTLAKDCKKKLNDYALTSSKADITRPLMRLCYSSTAQYAIVPMQDCLKLGKEARMNTPGVGVGNWSWRFKKEDLTAKLAKELHGMVKLYGRLPEKED